MNPTKEQIAAALAVVAEIYSSGPPLSAEQRREWIQLCRIARPNRPLFNDIEFAAQVLAAALRAAQQDSERLDWLDAEHTHDGRQRPVAALVLKRDFIRDSADWVNITGTVRAARAAIDSAMQAEEAFNKTANENPRPASS